MLVPARHRRNDPPRTKNKTLILAQSSFLVHMANTDVRLLSVKTFRLGTANTESLLKPPPTHSRCRHCWSTHHRIRSGQPYKVLVLSCR